MIISTQPITTDDLLRWWRILMKLLSVLAVAVIGIIAVLPAAAQETNEKGECSIMVHGGYDIPVSEPMKGISESFRDEVGTSYMYSQFVSSGGQVAHKYPQSAWSAIGGIDSTASFVNTGSGQMPLLDTARVLPPRYNPDKKIIEFGWGMLSAPQVRDNMASLSQRPVDGIVFMSKWPQYSPGYPQSIFYPYTVTEAYMELDTLASIDWGSNLTDNFLRFWVAGYVYADWFNDSQWATVLVNAQNISKANSVARTKGIFFDTEHYGSNIWKYDSVIYPNHTLGQVQAMVRQRGKELIRALQTYSPDIKVFCTGAWIFPNWETGGKPENIQNTPYCLLKSFCDGMLEGASGQAKIIDGNEIGYYWRNTINWNYSQGAYRVISDNIFIAPELKSKSDTNMQVGHGLMYTSYKPVNSLAKKRRLEHHVYEELLCSDEYMWFYTEEGQGFWLAPFPSDLDSIIRSAKKKIAAGKELGFTISSDTIVTYSNDLQITSPAHNQVFNIGDTISFAVQPSVSVSNINYFSSYKRLSNISNTPALQQFQAVYPGTYLVYAYSNGYLKLSNPVTYYVVDNPSSVERTDVNENEMLAYPNPAKNELTFLLKSGRNNRVEQVRIFNSTGQELIVINDISQSPFVVDTSQLAVGIYFYEALHSNKQTTRGKFLRE
jgi:hypothetical protein